MKLVAMTPMIIKAMPVFSMKHVSFSMKWVSFSIKYLKKKTDEAHDSKRHARLQLIKPCVCVMCVS